MQTDLEASGRDMELDAETGAAMLKLHEETHSTLHVRILEARGLRPREGGPCRPARGWGFLGTALWAPGQAALFVLQVYGQPAGLQRAAKPAGQPPG